MFDIRVNFALLIGFLTFSNFVTSRNDGWLHWTQWSDCPDLICSGERNKPLVRRSRECRNTVFGEDVCGEETVEVEEKNCRPNIPECTHEWTLWTNVSFWTVHYGVHYMDRSFSFLGLSFKNQDPPFSKICLSQPSICI